MKPKTNLFLPSALFAVITLLGAVNQTHAAVNTYQWNGTTNTSWALGTNWNASPGVGASGSSSDSRLNVYNGAGQTLIYSVTQGTTVYANTTGRGLVISQAGPLDGSMEITGGSFSTFGSTSGDVVGNARVGSLTVSGGSFTGAGTSAGGTILGLNSGSGTSNLTVSGSLGNPGSATFSTLQLSAATVNVNLNTYGTLTANQIVDVDNSGATGNSNTTFNFNGGTLKAGSGAVTDFMGLSGSSNALTNAYVKSGGAKIDTNGKSITISQALLDGTGGGGLTLDDTAVTKGTLTLSGTNTYTGATNVTNGKLIVNGSISTSTLTTVKNTGTLGGSGTVGAVTVETGGTLAPGNSPGNITASTLTLADNANFDIEINKTLTPTNDSVTLTGDFSNALAITTGANLNLALGGTFALGDRFTLASYNTANGTWNGGLFNLGAGTSTLADDSVFQSGGYDWRINYDDLTNTSTNSTESYVDGGKYLTLTVVPEPNVAALLGGLGMLALLRRRR